MTLKNENFKCKEAMFNKFPYSHEAIYLNENIDIKGLYFVIAEDLVGNIELEKAKITVYLPNQTIVQLVFYIDIFKSPEQRYVIDFNRYAGCAFESHVFKCQLNICIKIFQQENNLTEAYENLIMAQKKKDFFYQTDMINF